ncbi:hypothetical protein ACX8Z9_12140 [Arthrobacter halodurans]|uniref:Uncharacterized protein n=1 Tax=Arthrobacter halodurans TaxID=516699 RepID=A0ABV4UQ51_9MICC
MNDTVRGTPAEDLPTPVAGGINPGDEPPVSAAAAAKAAADLRHDHDEELVEEWEDESFPASDPPSNY